MPAKKPARAAAKIDQIPWSAIRPAPVVLVTGAETFLAERSIGMLRDLLVGEDPALEVHDLEADQYASGLLATLASPSLFGEPRLVRVTNVEKCTDAFITESISYLQAPADDVTWCSGTAGASEARSSWTPSAAASAAASRCSATRSSATPTTASTSSTPSSAPPGGRSLRRPCAPSSLPSPTTSPNSLPPVVSSLLTRPPRSPTAPSTSTTAAGSRRTRSRSRTSPSPAGPPRDRRTPARTVHRRGAGADRGGLREQAPHDGEGQLLPRIERAGGVLARHGPVAGAACTA